MLDRDMHVYC